MSFQYILAGGGAVATKTTDDVNDIAEKDAWISFLTLFFYFLPALTFCLS